MTYYKKYAVCYNLNAYEESCVLFHPNDNDLRFDGENYISKGGSEEFFLYVFDSLEEAVLKANYNPKHLKLILNNKSKRYYNYLVTKKYRWTKNKGFIERNVKYDLR